jgi:hypothetical protein
VSTAGLGDFRAPAEPFERRVVRTFAQSIQAMKELVVDPGKPPRVDEIHELVYRGVTERIAGRLPAGVRARLLALLQVPGADVEVSRLEAVRAVGLPVGLFADVAPKVLI